MTKDSGKLVSEETRPALGDLTNLPGTGKRVISSIPGDLIHKSEDGSGKTVAYGDSRDRFSKRLCLAVDDLVKENARPIVTTEGSTSDYKLNSGDSDDKESEESHDAISSGDGKGSCKYTKPLQSYSEPGDRDGARLLNVAAAGKQTDVTGEGLVSSVLTSITESRNPRVTGEELPNCQNLRSFEMGRCSNVNEKEHLNLNMGNDLLKSCSCSFCLKAANIWSDLHYQDIKGRLSVLKKSQKKANNLIQRIDKQRPTDLHATVNSVSSESKLMGHWRSLFLSMGGILAQESNHLQNKLCSIEKVARRLQDGFGESDENTSTPPNT